jgi:hypothetical protein
MTSVFFFIKLHKKNRLGNPYCVGLLVTLIHQLSSASLPTTPFFIAFSISITTKVE